MVGRIFPNDESCLRLVRALAVESHENWIEAIRYLNMEPLEAQKKERLRMAAVACLMAMAVKGTQTPSLPLHPIPLKF
jgi:hypothetical protein